MSKLKKRIGGSGEDRMQNILITGGAGFIGSNFIHYLQRNEPDAFVVNLDVLTYAANLENLSNLPDPERYRFIEGDICDRDLVDRIFGDYKINIVVHFAAESHVDRSIYGPAKFIKTNIVGTFKLLDAARHAWLTLQTVPFDKVHFHHVSTDEVYGALPYNDPPSQETSPYLPSSPYAASKAASDHLVRSYFHTFGLPITITNCSNNYGPRQFPEKLIPLMILNALKGHPLPLYGDGRQVRDWLYVEDHCEAIWQVVRRGKIGETYNVGGNNQPQNIQVVKEICALLDELVPDSRHTPHGQLCRFVSDRPGHDRRYAVSIDKVSAELGWNPREDLHSGLKKTIKWYLENTEWIREVSERPEYRAWLEKNYRAREAKK